MLGIHNAEHEETAPDAPTLVVSKLACSLVGLIQQVRIMPGTLAHRVYGKGRVWEQFRCHYGLNPAYRDQMSTGELRVAGVDSDGEVRIVELSNHRFFLAILFVPQLSSSPDRPHPLIVAYLSAARAFQVFQRRSQSQPGYSA
jgi:CTP synthase (UTP-ammonia lyase)